MTGPAIALYVASALATVSGVALARRLPAHAPVAALFGYGLAADVLARILKPSTGWGPHPVAGLDRVAFHAAQAALVGYPLAVLGGAVVVLGKRRVRPVVAVGAVAWTVYVTGLVLGYLPASLWDGRLERVYGVVQAVIVIGLAIVAIPWWRTRKREGRSPTEGEVVAIMACAVEVVNLVGPYAMGDLVRRWPLMAGAPYGLLYVVAALIQGGGLWRCF